MSEPVPVRPLPQPLPALGAPPEEAPAAKPPIRWQKLTAYAFALIALGLLPESTHQWVVAMFGTLVAGNGLEHWAKNRKAS